jgi:hypothetical protein
MTEHSQEPPPVLAFTRVLEYAVLGASVRYSGHSSLFVEGKELGPVPRLAICQPFDEAEFVLLHCDDEWEVLGAAGYASLAEAKGRAERIYPGVSACWIDRYITEAEAKDYVEREFGHERCRFCGKLPVDVERMVVHARGGPICNFCIEEFHAFIHEESEQS